ncbi:MAG: mobA-like transferase domain protein [Chitinophagaceae bacterium]|nr:mobA-like transferase domain protein [Chitinophagaceae bacterium]
MSKRSVILTGGKGVGDVSILKIIFNQLKKNDFTHITLTVSHKAEIIQAFFGDGSKWGITIDYSLEEKALSTMDL